MAVETSGHLEPRELRTLENLRLRPNRTYRGSSKGERISRQKGVSIEFADFRNYSEGDDLRHLDWNVLARLDSPVMRTYQDEEDVVLYVCMDCSPSMNFGDPSKLTTAQRYAMAFGYIGLVGGDGVRLKVLGAKQPPSGIMRGRSSAYRFIESVQRNGVEQNQETLNDSLRSLLRSNLRSGILVLISDGLDQNLPSTIRALGGRGFEVWHAQILSEIEIEPDLEGDLRLIDSEGLASTEITINRDTIQHYRRSLESHIVALSEAAKRTGGHHQLIRTTDSLEEIMTRKLKPGGLGHVNLQIPNNLIWAIPLSGIIIALYLLRMRRQDVRVPATFLWPEHTEEIRANSLFQKLRFNWLMVLQLLIACLLVFAFAQPQLRQEGLLGETTVIVIDTSASMRATDVTPSRFDSAVDLVRAAINTSKPSDRFALIEAGAIPRVAFSLSNDPAKQRDALNRLHATDEEGNMGEALRLASALVSSLDSARILVISDGCFPKVDNFSAGKASVVYKSIGTRQENLAVTALGSAKTARGNEVFCGVRNFGLNRADTAVEIFADNRLIYTSKVTMQSLKSAGVSCLAPASTKILHARIDAKDLLLADNELYASADPNSAISTLMISKGNPFLERALLLDPRVTLDRTDVLPNSEKGTVSKFDLIIFDGTKPQPVNSRAVVSFGSGSESSGATSNGIIDSPKVSEVTQSPLTKGVDFATTYIERSARLKPFEGAKTVVDSNKGPIVVADSGETKKVAVGFNILDSDFPLQVGFPIFIANILDFVASEVNSNEIVTRAGSTFAFRAQRDVSISGPDGYKQSVLAKDGQAIWRNISFAGKYTASVEGKSKEIFASLRSDTESNIATKPDLVLGGGKVKAIQTPFRLQDYWRIFVMICLGFLAFEWWVYSRKS